MLAAASSSRIPRRSRPHNLSRHLFASTSGLRWRGLHHGTAPWLQPGVEAKLPLDFKLDFDSDLGGRQQAARALQTASIVIQAPDPTPEPSPWKTIIKTDKRTGINIAFSPHHIAHPWAFRYLADYHPLTATKVRELLRKSTAEPLWWHVMVFHQSPGSHSVVVNYTVRRKIRRAFREALRRKGYDETGRGLADGENTNRPADAPTENDYLYGSVRLLGYSNKWLVMGQDQITTFFEEALDRQLIGLLRGARQQWIRSSAKGQKKKKKTKVSAQLEEYEELVD